MISLSVYIDLFIMDFDISFFFRFLIASRFGLNINYSLLKNNNNIIIYDKLKEINQKSKKKKQRT